MRSSCRSRRRVRTRTHEAGLDEHHDRSQMHDRGRWQSVATSAQKLETRLFIDGKFVDARKGGRFSQRQPGHRRNVLPKIAAGTAEDI